MFCVMFCVTFLLLSFATLCPGGVTWMRSPGVSIMWTGVESVRVPPTIPRSRGGLVVADLQLIEILVAL